MSIYFEQTQIGLRNTALIFSLSLLLLLHTCNNLEAASPETKATMVFEVGDNGLAMQAINIPLGDILDEMRGEFFSDITGLDHRTNELITLNTSGKTVEEILKQLLKHLGENNYAFEFSDDDIKKVSVFPESKTKTTPAEKQRTLNEDHDQFTGVAKVNSIIEDSQAETVGLAVDDIIIKYDGIRIESSMGLIREVRRKSDMDQVEMIVVREGTVLPFFIKGGLIGVRISTAKIPLEEFERYN